MVTGRVGPIGSYIVEKLLGTGHEVVCLNNFYGYDNPALKEGHIGRFIVFGIILTIMATGIFVGYLDGYVVGKAIMVSRTNTIGIIKNYQNVSDDALKIAYLDSAVVRSDIVIKKYHLNVFS